MATTHRIWDFRGDQVAVVWFQKQPDGSARVLQTYVGGGAPEGLTAEPGSVDYFRAEATHLFPHARARGLNPEVLPAAAWRSPAPFAVAA